MAKLKVLLAWLFICGLFIFSAGIAMAADYPANVAGVHYFVIGNALDAADGTPINGKTVNLYPADNPKLILASAVVAGNKYLLNALADFVIPPGNYQLSIANDPFGYGVAASNLTITGNGWDAGPDLQLAKVGQPFGSLSVKVFEFGTQNLIPGATIKIEGLNDFTNSQIAPNGQYIFNNLPIGDYKVTVSNPPVFAEHAYLAVKVDAGLVTELKTELVRIIIPGTGSLVGFVKDLNGNPIDDVKIVVIGTDYQAVSANGGKYLINNINPPGPYQLEASKVNFSNTIIDGIMVAADKSTSLDIYLTPIIIGNQANLIGHIRDSDVGTFLAGANVTLYGVAQVSNQFGLYQHLNVNPGLNVPINCQLNQYKDQAAQVNLVEGKTVQHDFALSSILNFPSINNLPLPEGTEAQLYNGAGFQLTAINGKPPYQNWTAQPLPNGLVINPDTGVISGTPAIGSANLYHVITTVTDQQGNISDPLVLDLTINPKDGAVQLMLSKLDTNNDGQVDSVKIAWAAAALPDIYYLIGNGTGSFAKAIDGWSGPLDLLNAPPEGFSFSLNDKYIVHNNQIGAGAGEVYYKGQLHNLPKANLINIPAVGKINVALKGALANGEFLGKNLVSVPLIPSSNTINDVFGTGFPWEEGEMIQKKNAATPYYISAVYKAADVKWRDGGDTSKDPKIVFDGKYGYWIITKSNKTITFVGAVPGEDQIADEDIWGKVSDNESGQTLLGLYHPKSVGLVATSLIANGALANDMIQYKKDALNPAYISAVVKSENGQLVWKDAANAANQPVADIATLKAPNSYIYSRIGGAGFTWHKGVQY